MNGYTLRDIAVNMRMLLDEIAEGNVMESEAKDTLAALEDSAAVKVDNICEFAKSLEREESAIKDEVKRLNDKAKSVATKKLRLVSLLETYLRLIDKNEVKGSWYTAKFKQNPPKVMVIDENLIPEAYKKIKQEITVDKTAIKKAISGGEVIAGAMLVQEERIDIQ